MENPVVTSLKKKKESMSEFLYFIGKNSDKNGTKISINFKHNRFRESTGFALLEFEGSEMYNIIRKIEQAVEEEIKSINGTIERYGKDNKGDDRRSDTVGSMDQQP